MKTITLILLSAYVTFSMKIAQADPPSSMPIILKEGQTSPFTGYLLTLELGKDMAEKSQLALKVPLLEQLNVVNNQIIEQQKLEITDLKQDKKNLLDTNQKIQDDYKNANKYNSWIFAGFFAGGVLFTLGIVLVTGYALEKVGSGKSGLVINSMANGVHF